VRARIFVNATGPFSDRVRKLANPSLPARLRVSKGVHILLPLPPGPRMSALLIPQTDDGRVIFAIPWQGRLLVGTTDDEATLDEELLVKRSEVEYLLRHLNRYFSVPYSAGQAVSAFAGLRPLVSHGEARSSSKLIRDHEVEIDSNSGLISILGGKWTTYRAMAEDTVNAAQDSLRIAATGSARCRTRHFPLLGAEGWEPGFWQTLVSNYHIPASTAQHLSGKFGSRAVEVLELVQQDRKLAEPVIAGAPAIQAEIVYGIRCEMATSIEDVLARRIGLELFSWNSAMEAAPVVGGYLAQECGLSPQAAEQATREYVLKLMRLSAIAGFSGEWSIQS